MHFSSLLASVLAAALVSAHGNHDIHREQAIRRSLLQDTKKDLSHCAAKMKERGLEARNIQRRKETAAALAKKRGLPTLKPRDLSSLNESHYSSENYTIDTSEDIIFSGDGSSCILSPEVTVGPYYVAGEYIRSDVTEGQAGVGLHFEFQILDVETCEPIVGAYTEIWHANSTGVYSGVSAANNGDSDTDKSNLNATFLRGAQQTDADGVSQFDTLVPGHYTGRANHIHVMVHLNATPQANGTILDTTASHSGQVFFDQSLLGDVEALEPYSDNTQDWLQNDEDSILSQEAVSSDPFTEYVLLGDSLEDGLLGWLAFGVNTSLSQTVSAAAYYYASGGVSSSSGGSSPGGSGGLGNLPGGNPPQ